MKELPAFLEIKEMRKHYGAIKAVDGVSMSVGPGEIVGVIGPNGSGKTTLFNSILGQIKPTSGAVEFCGEDITGMSPLELSRRGVGRTFQTLQVFVKLSVRDNLIAAAQEFKGTLASRLLARPDAGLGDHADPGTVLGRQGAVPRQVRIEAPHGGCGEQSARVADPAEGIRLRAAREFRHSASIR